MGYYRVLYSKHHRHGFRQDERLGNNHGRPDVVRYRRASLLVDEGKSRVDLQNSWANSIRIPRLVDLLVLSKKTPLGGKQSAVRSSLHFRILRHDANLLGRLPHGARTCSIPARGIDRPSARFSQVNTWKDFPTISRCSI